jgi:hypothetical protein
MYRWALDSLLIPRDTKTNTEKKNKLLLVTAASLRSRALVRDVRAAYASPPYLTDIGHFVLPFSTSGPADTALLALQSDDDPFWVIDNDVIHDPETDFSITSDETVKVIVADISEELSATGRLDGAMRAERGRQLPSSPSVDEEARSPYCHVITDAIGNVIDVCEKPPLKVALRSPYAVMGGYGFSSSSLFRELHRDAILFDPQDPRDMSSIVKAGVRMSEHRRIRVLPVLTTKSFTVGTPEQLRAALRIGLLSSRTVVVDTDTDEEEGRHASFVMSPQPDGGPITWRSPKLTWVFDLEQAEEEQEQTSASTPLHSLLEKVRADGHRVVFQTSYPTVERAEYPFIYPTDVVLPGKPLADVVVDANAVNPRKWSLRSPAQDDTDRCAWMTGDIGFGWENELLATPSKALRKVRENVVLLRGGERCVKFAERPGQLRGYAYYLRNAPERVRKHVPVLYAFGQDEGGREQLEMEWCRGVDMSRVNAWGLLDGRMMGAVLRLLTVFHQVNEGSVSALPLPGRTASLANYMPKLRRRLEEGQQDRDLYGEHVLDIPVKPIIQRLDAFFETYEPEIRSCIHGDFWLGNLIWQPAEGAAASGDVVRAIDMRGMLGDECSVGGDAVYDYAKLYQSMVGFDALVCERDPVPPREEHVLALETHVREATCGRVTMSTVRIVTFSLMFGCVAFHRSQVEKRPSVWRRCLLQLYADAFERPSSIIDINASNHA